MGDTRDGHTLPAGRPGRHDPVAADYGGAPNYTMYVPVDWLLADMKAGRTG
jgi:hypothetical protein